MFAAEDGYSIPAALALTLVGLMMWSAAYQRLSSVLHMEERSVREASDAPISGPVLAVGMDLLKTGQPPSDRYSCRVVSVRAGERVERLVAFQRVAASLWLVSDEALAWWRSEDCPRSFAVAAGAVELEGATR